MAYPGHLLRLSHMAIKLSTGLCFHMEAQLENNLLPSSFRLLVEFISLCLYEWGSQLLLAVGWKAPSASRGYLQLLCMWASSRWLKPTRRISHPRQDPVPLLKANHLSKWGPPRIILVSFWLIKNQLIWHLNYICKIPYLCHFLLAKISHRLHPYSKVWILC